MLHPSLLLALLSPLFRFSGRRGEGAEGPRLTAEAGRRSPVEEGNGSVGEERIKAATKSRGKGGQQRDNQTRTAEKKLVFEGHRRRKDLRGDINGNKHAFLSMVLWECPIFSFGIVFNTMSRRGDDKGR
uniref:Uncharacterized protein n=1 Tax=Sphaerodactylus townsendi TaxID=933632 RepID=A0ACB8G4T5_9SAUR